eukprot:gnl/TRDRNA2_/TRDRNA2_150765_c0_seq1.p1 gnl/TRDRNA2_/TRDRNA2_150765_c0~~gnl/TRDRNA2_/TRDRNA2_150765_c0_seq1.p1  ORF type:complete len:363 (-),score=-19.86 gnl/TRDRNA2_/TRDRNA2_150765_c0_seq1:123-1211(-)
MKLTKKIPSIQKNHNFLSSNPRPNKSLIYGKRVEKRALRRSIELYSKSSIPKSINPGINRAFSVSPRSLEEAYTRCGIVTGEYAKTFYLGTQLMPVEKAQAIWAVYVWCRRTDELVDGPNASKITPRAIDRWEERLEAIFDGRPYDSLDATLTDTVSRFPIDIQPFRDMIGGMRMDTAKSRYETFDELYEYCYRVAGTVGLMSTPVMGIDTNFNGTLDTVFKSALALGTANQLTNILRDVGEDAQQRDRIYLPLEELDKFGISDREVLMGLHVPTSWRRDDRWEAFMRYQIKRARKYFELAEEGISGLDELARWPVWSAHMLYRQILEAIENNNVDNFSRRAYVSKLEKFSALPIALLKAAT